jgi:hypothetical protein
VEAATVELMVKVVTGIVVDLAVAKEVEEKEVEDNAE